MDNLDNKLEIRWEDLRIPLTSVKAGLVNPPTFTAWKDDGNSSVGTFLWWFEPTKYNNVFFATQLPHGYMEGSDITFHIHWVTDNSTTGTVYWEFEYNWANIDEIFSTNNTVINVLPTTNIDPDYHLMHEIGTLDGTGKKISSMLNCRLSRNGASDTFIGNAGILEIDFHYRMDELGSRLELSKN